MRPRDWILIAAAILFGVWQGGLFTNKAGLFAEGAAEKAMRRIMAKWPADTRIHSIDITRTEMKVVARVHGSNSRYEECSYRTLDHYPINGQRGRGIRFAHVHGPWPSDPVILGLEVGDTLFSTADVNLAGVAATAREAAERVALEGGGKTVAMRIDRTLGAIGWGVTILGPQEKAHATADAQGKVIEVNLRGTSRATSTDYLSGGGLLESALSVVRRKFGADRIFQKIEISRSSVDVVVADSENPGKTVKYSYNVNGLSKVSELPLPAEMQRLLEKPVAAADLFGLDDANWTLVPVVASEALKKVSLPKGKVFEVSLARRQGTWDQTEWRVKVMEGLIGPMGFAYFDSKSGEFLRVD